MKHLISLKEIIFQRFREALYVLEQHYILDGCVSSVKRKFRRRLLCFVDVIQIYDGCGMAAQFSWV